MFDITRQKARKRGLFGINDNLLAVLLGVALIALIYIQFGSGNTSNAQQRAASTVATLATDIRAVYPTTVEATDVTSANLIARGLVQPANTDGTNIILPLGGTVTATGTGTTDLTITGAWTGSDSAAKAICSYLARAPEGGVGPLGRNYRVTTNQCGQDNPTFTATFGRG